MKQDCLPSGSGANYNSTEQQDGFWFDKPRYRKTINIGTLPNNTTKTVPHGIANIKYIIKVEGTTMQDVGYIKTVPSVDNGTTDHYSGRISTNADFTNVYVRTFMDYAPYNYNTTYVTIYYTKTTD